MNMLELLINALYHAAEESPLGQRMIAAAVQGYNDRMAEINRTEPVQAVRR